MTVGVQAIDQAVPVEAINRLFPGGINISDDDRVGIVEAGTEIFEQVAAIQDVEVWQRSVVRPDETRAVALAMLESHLGPLASA